MTYVDQRLEERDAVNQGVPKMTLTAEDPILDTSICGMPFGRLHVKERDGRIEDQAVLAEKLQLPALLGRLSPAVAQRISGPNLIGTVEFGQIHVGVQLRIPDIISRGRGDSVATAFAAVGQYFQFRLRFAAEVEVDTLNAANQFRRCGSACAS